MGQENVKLSHDQIERICALLKKESIVEELEQVRQSQPLHASPPKMPTPQQPQQKQESSQDSGSSSTSTSSQSTTGLENEKGEKRKERVAQ